VFSQPLIGLKSEKNVAEKTYWAVQPCMAHGEGTGIREMERANLHGRLEGMSVLTKNLGWTLRRVLE